MTRRLIAVTGATGAVGSRFIPMARAKGFNLLALSRTRPEALHSDIEWRPFNLDDPVDETAAKLHGVDQIVHLAAVIHGRVPADEGDSSLWNVNVLGTQRLIAAMAVAKVPRLAITGTANLYQPDLREANEESPFWPKSRVLYLASKAAQEWLAASECHANGIDCAILRISSVIGDGKSIVDRLAGKIANGETVRIDDGAAFGADFIDCYDVSAGLLLAVEARLQGVFNLSSGIRTELIDAVLYLANKLGRPPQSIEMVHASAAPDTGFPAINCDRLRSYGYAPTPLDDVLDAIAARAMNGTQP